MSRWTDAFSSHPFHKQWDRLLGVIDKIPGDDPVLIPHTPEISRLRKGVGYLDKALKGIDPELVPLNFWDAVHAQISPCADQVTNFNANKNIGHIHNANQNLDVLLSYIRPYLLAEGVHGAALQEAAKAYAETLTRVMGKLSSKVVKLIEDIEQKQSKSAAELSRVEEMSTSVEAKHDLLLVGSDEQEPIFEAMEQAYKDIALYANQLSVGSEKEPAIKQRILLASEQVQKDQKAIADLLAETKQTVKDLGEFHIKILGRVNSEGAREDGLQQKLDQRIVELESVEDQQKARYQALNTKIESLLPGATSAGLASAYKEMKDSFSQPIANAHKMFYGSIGALVLLSIVLSIDQVSRNGIDFVQMTDWQSVLRSLAHKLPFYAPVLWLAYYASKRRSEFQRLEQEYAHKEALAKSYDSYRQQILELGSEDRSLMQELISKAVDAIAHNASTSLDGKHGDKAPHQEFMEKVIASTMEQVRKSSAQP